MKTNILLAIGLGGILMTITPHSSLASDPGTDWPGPKFGAQAIKLRRVGKKGFQTSEVVKIPFTLRQKNQPASRLSFSMGVNPVAALKSVKAVHFFVTETETSDRPRLVYQKTVPVDPATPLGWINDQIPLEALPLRDLTLVFNSSATFHTKTSTTPVSEFSYWGAIRMGRFSRSHQWPNIILISMDTLRPDRVSFNGYQRTTSPELDKLASGGVWFKEAVANSPWTKPSHMSVFTGLLPSLHGVNSSWRNHAHAELRGSIKTLAELLRDHDYLTEAVTGSGNVSSAFGFYRGFDHYVENSKGLNHDAEFIFTNGIRWLEANKHSRFFLFLHTYEIHGPFTHKYFLSGLPNPSPQQALDARYDSGVYTADRHLGRFLNKLKSTRLTNNTVIVVFSDHGEDLNTHYKGVDHGHTLYDEITRCVLLFYGPDYFSPRVVPLYQGQLIDIMPTLMDLLGLEFESLHLSGTSLLPILKGTPPPEKSFALSEGMSWGPERKGLRYTDGSTKLKYIAVQDPNKIKEFQEAPRPGSGWLKQMNYFLYKSGGEEFYDLVKDPGEKKNINDPKSVKQNWLKEKLKSYLDTIKNIVAEPTVTLDSDLREKLKSLGY